jgi:hypothetical protein
LIPLLNGTRLVGKANEPQQLSFQTTIYYMCRDSGVVHLRKDTLKFRCRLADDLCIDYVVHISLVGVRWLIPDDLVNGVITHSTRQCDHPVPRPSTTNIAHLMTASFVLPAGDSLAEPIQNNWVWYDHPVLFHPPQRTKTHTVLSAD